MPRKRKPRPGTLEWIKQESLDVYQRVREAAEAAGWEPKYADCVNKFLRTAVNADQAIHTRDEVKQMREILERTEKAEQNISRMLDEAEARGVELGYQ